MTFSIKMMEGGKSRKIKIMVSMKCVCCMLSHISRVQLCVTLWTVARQAPQSMGFSKQENWSGLPFPSPGDLSDSEIEPMSLKSSALVGRFFNTGTTWEAIHDIGSPITMKGKFFGRLRVQPLPLENSRNDWNG